MAEFVPTTFDMGSNYAHLWVEQDNMLPTATIAYSKYIKPQHLQASNQKVAHIIIGFNDQKAANRAIEHGLFRHYVADCKAETDRCARCGKKHQTTLCTVMDPSSHKCMNCIDNPKGHGTADRTCPAYLKEKGKLHEHIPENKYRYFPTNDPHTWQLLN
jgi:hypothetical protein